MGYAPRGPKGIPISAAVHEQFPDDVKAAWDVLNNWWQDAREKSKGELIPMSTMPARAKEAMELINRTPIPGYDGYTGADSCYMQGVVGRLVDDL